MKNDRIIGDEWIHKDHLGEYFNIDHYNRYYSYGTNEKRISYSQYDSPTKSSIEDQTFHSIARLFDHGPSKMIQAGSHFEAKQLGFLAEKRDEEFRLAGLYEEQKALFEKMRQMMS
jgi:hypothetical protein